MTQSFTFKVHSVHQAPMVTKASLPDGQEVDATVSGLVVEMINDDASVTQTRRFIPTDLDAALTLYVKDAVIISTDAPPVVPKAPDQAVG